MIMLFFIIICILLASLYIRYCPVGNVKCTNTLNHNIDIIEIVDVRDYNQSYKDPVSGSINIPYAYMKRRYSDISRQNVHVVASDYLERNMSIRFLRKKGFNIVGYSLTGCDC